MVFDNMAGFESYINVLIDHVSVPSTCRNSGADREAWQPSCLRSSRGRGHLREIRPLALNRRLCLYPPWMTVYWLEHIAGYSDTHDESDNTM